MDKRVDVAVVGAGPAGARVAELLARQGRTVALLDPKAPWEKPCGGGLTPPAFREIPELEAIKDAARPVHRVRIETDPDQGFSVELEEPIWIVSRLALSRWQLDRAVEAGAEHLPFRVRDLRRTYDGWRLSTDSGVIATDFVVGADGAASLVRRVAAPKFRVELAPTRVAYPTGVGPTPDHAVMRFFAGLAGYLWDFPRPDHRSVGIGVPGGTKARPWLDGEIDLYRDSGEDCSCRGMERAGAVIGTAQLGHGDYAQIAGNDFALLGDAAGFADPLTGEGIQNALRSADLLAQAMTAERPTAYRALARKAFEAEFAVARIARRFVFEGDFGVGLVRWAARSWLGYATIAAVVNAVNEHGGGVRRFSRWWSRAAGHARRGTELARPRARVPLPCACVACGVGPVCHEVRGTA